MTNFSISNGDNIESAYTDSQHQNPLSRVVSAQFLRNNDSLDYDKEKYKEMLLMLLNLFWEFLDSIERCSMDEGQSHSHLGITFFA